MKLPQFFSKIFFIVTIVVFSSTLTSCERDEDNNNDCISLANDITVTAQAYSSDPNSVANCNAYKAALEAYISGCYSSADISSFQETLRDLDCE
ncbi:hypothetical protein ACE193_08120 [Bernardetia sp. OM2101]|uniref:hypothetical protein n=1 Tax=Bernardetia sp. OM2101 TaxID=3344876 RepID=UPI0035CFCD93